MAIHVDIFGRLQERDLQRQIDKMADDLDTAGQRAGSRLGDGVASGMMASSPKVQKAFNSVETASERATQALTRYRKGLQDNNTDSETMTRLSIALGKARRDEADAHRAAASVLRTVTQETRNASGALEELKRTLVSPTRALVSIAGPELIAALIQTAQVAVTATQALLLLPAAATAAGAGMLTLKLATDGFGQAMKDIHDIKKFNDDIAQLSPNAQSAAMAIKTMLPQLDGLKNATQDAFFAGFDQKIQQLSGTFLPSIQGLTTGIASAMNQSISGVADMLMSPSGKSDVAAIATNIGEAFRAAAPAVQSFSQAFLEITKVGSNFLPSLGEGIAGAAREFASFIHDAAESGKLKDWIQQGINAAEALGSVIADIGKRIYQVFGGASQSEIDAWRTNMTDSLDIIQGILTTLTTTLEVLNAKIPGIGKGFLEWVNPLLIIRDIVNGIRWFLDPTYKADNSPIKAATQKLNDARAKIGQPPVDEQGHVIGPDNYSSSSLGSGSTGSSNQNFNGLLAALTRLPGEGAVAGRGLSTFLGRNENSSGWGPGGGLFSDPSKASWKDKASKYSAPADQWALGSVPIGSFPGVGGTGPLPTAGGTNIPGFGATNLKMTQEIWDAQSAVITAGHNVEESRQTYLRLAHDNTTSETELLKAKNNVGESERAFISSQLKLAETANNRYKDLASALGEVGAALDKDLGISKGLPGIADNLVRFLASIAAAPMMGRMAADIANDPHKGGYGLIGIAGAQGAFGPQFTGLDQGATGQYTPPNYGTGGATGAAQGAVQNATGIPAAVNAFLAPLVGPGGPGTSPNGFPLNASEQGFSVNGVSSQAAAGGPAQRLQQFAQWFNDNIEPVKQLAGYDAGGHGLGNQSNHTSGTALDINWDDFTALQGHGADARTHFSPTQMQAISQELTQTGMTWGQYWTPDSRDPGHFELGGAPYAKGPQNIDPTTGQPTSPTTPGSTTPLPGGPPMPVPLPVTIVGGGAPGGGMAWGGAGQPSGGGPSAGGHLANWDKIVGPEAGGNWANTSNPNFSGGLQFTPSSWASAGGLNFAPTAAQASPEDQKTVADKLLQMQGPGAWPATSAAHPEWFHPPTTPGAGSSGPMPTTPANPFGPPGLPDVSGNAWMNNQAGVPLYSPLAQGPGQYDPNIGPGPLQVGAPDLSGVGTPAPGSIGPFGVPPSVAAAGPMAGAGLAGGAGAVGPTHIGSLAPPGGISPGSGIGITPGGSLDTAISMAASAFPGLGQAAQTGMKLANRAIQYGGQLAGIGVQGLMETFLPTGGSELANNGWLPRIIGGIAGAAPQLPNVAGGKGGAPAPPPLTPDQVSSGQGTGPPPGPVPPITINNNNASPDQNGRIIAHHVGQSATLPGNPNKPGQ